MPLPMFMHIYQLGVEKKKRKEERRKEKQEKGAVKMTRSPCNGGSN